VVIAAIKKLVGSGTIKRDELTVAFITGAGPRTQEVVADIVQPAQVQPSVASFEEVLGARV
jgi:threonine synthase